jgi:DNA helicase-2/ATP-dependent DNA helicase PcrA
MLNPSQERAVKHFGKPLLIIAGAGSGKTRTLAYKLEYLVNQKDIRQDRVLVLTFTNKSAREIKERIIKTSGRDVPWVGTFHSFALRLLKQDGHRIGISPSFGILDEEDRKKILKSLLKQAGLEKETLYKVESYIFSRCEDLNPPQDNKLEEIYQAYRERLKADNLLDFSELLLRSYELLKDYPQKWRDFFDFIMVDEFQDTNTVQYQILKLLAKENICVVGDPNQCIYEWRYARPDNLLKFTEDFNPDIIKLEYNYRSGKYIISVANAVLSASKARWKHMVPMLRAVRDSREKPIVRRFSNELEESAWIAQEIKRLLDRFKPSDIAILVRTGYLTDTLERALFNAKVPYKTVGTVRFFERAEVKDALAFLRIAVNPSDELSFKRCLEVAKTGIGNRSFDKIKGYYQGNWLLASKNALKDLSDEQKHKLYKLITELSKLSRNMDNYPTALKELLESIDYADYMRVRYQKDHQERKENLEESLRFLEEKKKDGSSLSEVLQEVSLISQEEESSSAVSIMTIHASKGLEFSVVFLPRLEEGILPHEKSTKDIQELEEERRLFYVAITRAKDMLYITYTKERGKKPSRFLSDIPKEFLDLSAYKVPKPMHHIKVGDTVMHRIFGKGRVLALEDERAKVDFGEKVKTIHVAFLEVVL